MSLGKTNSNFDNKKEYSPTVYSGYRFSNIESNADKSRLSFSMQNGFLKIIIEPKIEGDEIKFDKDNAGDCYLTHTKARMLCNEISCFMKSNGEIKSAGVSSGVGIITIESGEEYGCGPCLVIRKVDEEGRVVSSYLYEFRKNFTFSIRNFNDKTKDFDKVYDDYSNIEIEQFQVVLSQFADAMANATAYSVVNAMKYTTNGMVKKIDAIADKMGVSFKKQSYNSGSGGSFFNNNSSQNTKPASYENTTLDKIVDDYED